MNRQYLNLPNLTQLYFPKHLHKVVDLLYGENLDTYLAIQLFSTTDFRIFKAHFTPYYASSNVKVWLK